MFGARAVRQSIIEGFPQATIGVGIVWINMLTGDTEAAAAESAQIVDDARVRHFYDPEQRAGKAVAQSLGWEGKVAWDIYLFYPKGSRWGDSPPVPSRWMYQLSESWVDPAHYRWGDDLLAELHETMNKLMHTEV